MNPLRLNTAWTAIFAALIAATSFIPTLPYPTGGGILPLSVALAALSTLILGFGPGILAALLGGVIGVFVNPIAYPFGLVDAFFLAVFPALCTSLAFGARKRRVWLFTLIFFTLSGLFAEFVPYVYPGQAKGFDSPSQPLYSIVVSLFFVPWLALYASRFSQTTAFRWINDPLATKRFAGFLLGILSGLMLWSLWQISLWALSAGFSSGLTLTLWAYAGASRFLLAVMAAFIGTALIPALRKSSMPAPSGAIWEN